MSPWKQQTHNGFNTTHHPPEQADDLREKLRQLEAKYSEADEARATAEGDLEQQRARAEESLARVAAAEEEVRVHAAARAEAEERAAAAVATTDALEGAGGAGGAGEKADEEEGGAVDERAAAAEAAAVEAQSEVSSLKKAFREERKEHEAMLLQSRCVCARLCVCVCSFVVLRLHADAPMVVFVFCGAWALLCLRNDTCH